MEESKIMDKGERVVVPEIISMRFMEPLFTLLEKTKGVTQHEVYHPEGDVFLHSVQTMLVAFRETNDTDLILAAMLHDVGKQVNPLGHEKESVKLIEDHVSAKTLFLVGNHMRFKLVLSGEMKRRMKVRDLIEHSWLPELVQLVRFDASGRNPRRQVRYSREEVLERLNKAAWQHFQEREF